MKILSLVAIIFMFHLSNAQEYINQSEIFSMSYSFERDTNYSKAIEILKQNYQANSYPYNIRLGWLHYHLGDHLESMKYYRKAMELMPYSIESKFGYALPLFMLGNWDELKKTYEQILSIDPNNTIANYRMGLYYYERNQYDLAFKHTEKVVNLYPFDFDSVILLAWINQKMNNLRQAEVLFKTALLIYPDNESAIEGLKLIY